MSDWQVARRPSPQKDLNLAELSHGQPADAEISGVLCKDWRSVQDRLYSYMRWTIVQTRLCISVGPVGPLHHLVEAGATVLAVARPRTSAESETQRFG